MIYQKVTTGSGRCLLLVRKTENEHGFELWRRSERCWYRFDNNDTDYFKNVLDIRGEVVDISEAEARVIMETAEERD
ncbi:hypothetical protein [Phascolarctobacterium sp.]|uniref:hypothetical protein n=1 Tax=Phascolarctobacterium sp. TaxID=2049039 RepID=UPI0025F3E793|nr:hypothetical protein [uncultured Phascolarctobacterium sp.]